MKKILRKIIRRIFYSFNPEIYLFSLPAELAPKSEVFKQVLGAFEKYISGIT